MILRDRYPRSNRISSKLNVIKSNNSSAGFQYITWARQKKTIFPALLSHRAFHGEHLFYAALAGPLPSCAWRWAPPQKKYWRTEDIRPIIIITSPKQLGGLAGKNQPWRSKCNVSNSVQGTARRRRVPGSVCETEGCARGGTRWGGLPGEGRLQRRHRARRDAHGSISKLAQTHRVGRWALSPTGNWSLDRRLGARSSALEPQMCLPPDANSAISFTTGKTKAITGHSHTGHQRSVHAERL